VFDSIIKLWNDDKRNSITVAAQRKQTETAQDVSVHKRQSNEEKRLSVEDDNYLFRDGGFSRNDDSIRQSLTSTTSSPPEILGWQSPGTQIWARLMLAGLEVKCVYSHDLRRIMFKIRCPVWRLEEVAEQMNLKLKNRFVVINDSIESLTESSIVIADCLEYELLSRVLEALLVSICRDGTMRRFKISKRDTFLPNEMSGTIFRSSVRQHIIDTLISSDIKDGG
jgi:hypothetical protein